MKIKKIIEKAIEGGWTGYEKIAGHMQDEQIIVSLIKNHMLDEMFLDSKFWEAVGKVEGWTWILDNENNNGEIKHLDLRVVIN